MSKASQLGYYFILFNNHFKQYLKYVSSYYWKYLKIYKMEIKTKQNVINFVFGNLIRKKNNKIKNIYIYDLLLY